MKQFSKSILSTYLSITAVSAAALLIASGSAAAQDAFDWSGVYVGATAGATETSSDANIVYGGGEYGGWTAPDGFFAGEIYEDLNETGVYVDSDTYGDFDDEYMLSLDNLSDWVTEAESGELAWTGTVFAGAQGQFGALVLGAELRASFGEMGAGYSELWNDYASDSGTAYCDVGDDIEDEGDACIVTVVPDDYWTSIDINGDTLFEGDWAEITGSVAQVDFIGFGASVDQSFAAVARAGIAADSFLMYGLAGAAVAHVTASTSAYVQESGGIEVDTSYESDDSYGLVNYAWYGESSEDMVGLVLGAGLEYAMTDNVILRGEVSYANYGDISVTGYSMDTDATYEVTQSISQTKAEAGVLFKF